LENNIITVTIIREGAMFHWTPDIKTVATIAKIYITPVNGKIIKKVCDKCDSICYE